MKAIFVSDDYLFIYFDGKLLSEINGGSEQEDCS